MRYLHIMDELFASDTIIFLLIGLFVACIIGIQIRSTKKCLVGMITSLVIYVLCEVGSNIHITWMFAFLALFIGTIALGGCVGFLFVVIATKVKNGKKKSDK